MISEDLKQAIIEDFERYCLDFEDEIKNQDILKTISDYVNGNGIDWWDFQMYEDIDRKQFGISEELTTEEAIIEIQDIITQILIESEVA